MIIHFSSVLYYSLVAESAPVYLYLYLQLLLGLSYLDLGHYILIKDFMFIFVPLCHEEIYLYFYVLDLLYVMRFIYFSSLILSPCAGLLHVYYFHFIHPYYVCVVHMGDDYVHLDHIINCMCPHTALCLQRSCPVFSRNSFIYKSSILTSLDENHGRYIDLWTGLGIGSWRNFYFELGLWKTEGV